jgi:hypothetical protein
VSIPLSFRLAIATGILRRLRAPLLLSLFVSIGSGSLASAQLVNGGFELENTSGWSEVIPVGGVIEVVSFGSGSGGIPKEGDFFAHMKPDGDGSFTTLSQTFAAVPGDEIKGFAFFFDGESNVVFPDVEQDCFFADSMAVDIMAGAVVVAPADQVYFAKHCPNAPPDPVLGEEPIEDGSTGWTEWSYTFDGTEEMGPYTVRAKITNIGDDVFDSFSGVDDVQLVPDSDEDGIPDGVDNCPDDPNVTQKNSDTDALGDACDS